MQECPCCLEPFQSDKLVVPPCKVHAHSACKECTEAWQNKKQRKICMVCNTDERKSIFLHWFLLGFAAILLMFRFLYIYDWSTVIVSLNQYVYLHCYHSFHDTLPKRTMWMHFVCGLVTAFVGFIACWFCFSVDTNIFLFFMLYTMFLFTAVVHAVWFVTNLMVEHISYRTIWCVRAAFILYLSVTLIAKTILAVQTNIT